MTCDVLCAAPIAAQKHKQTVIVHLRPPRRCITAPLRLRFVKCSADRKVLLRRSQYLTPLHSIHRLLRNPGTTEMIEVVKDGEGCGGGNDARGDERHGYVRLKRANHDVQGNQEYNDRSGQQHHAVGKRFAKRNYRLMLLAGSIVVFLIALSIMVGALQANITVSFISSGVVAAAAAFAIFYNLDHLRSARIPKQMMNRMKRR